MRSPSAKETFNRPRTFSWSARAALLALMAVAISIVFVTNRLLTDRFTENTRNRAELRLVLYSGNLLSELRQNAIVPQLLARDPALIIALNSADYTQSTARLISFVEEIGAKTLTLLDKGRADRRLDRPFLTGGKPPRNRPISSMRCARPTRSSRCSKGEAGDYRFFYSRRIESQNQLIGVIVVEVDLAKYERAVVGHLGCGPGDRQRGQDHPFHRTALAAACRKPTRWPVSRSPAPSNGRFRPTQDWTTLPADAYLQGEAVMRVEVVSPFAGGGLPVLQPTIACGKK